MFEFKILKKDKKNKARLAEFNTPHGKLTTPELAFVATEAELRAIPKEFMPKLPVNLIIVNTYHLWTKKIADKIYHLGHGRDLDGNTVHNYANFPKPIMSDSGGFQVFSLGFGKSQGVGKIANIFPDEDQKVGVEVLGIPAARSRGLSNPKRALTGKKLRQVPHLTNQALFAIVQGGEYEDLRLQSSKFMAKQNVPGFGIGGSLGMSKEDMHNILDWTIPNLPEEKPRHLLGIGQVKDIFECIERGVDTFDCVIPTREARHRVLYTKKGHRNIRKLRSFNEVIEKDCECIACSQSVTFVQLAQLFSKKDPRAFFYATAHNIQFYADLMKNIRTSIEHNRLSKLKEKYLRYYQ